MSTSFFIEKVIQKALEPQRITTIITTTTTTTTNNNNNNNNTQIFQFPVM